MPKASLSEDALLRMLVAAIAETIARLALLRTAGQFAQAQQQIDQDLEELLGLKADLARQLSDQKIVEMLTTNEFLDVGRLYYVAELFRQEAEILKAQGQSAFAQTSQVRALSLPKRPVRSESASARWIASGAPVSSRSAFAPPMWSR